MFEVPATTELYDAIPKSIRVRDEKGTLFLKRLLYPLENALTRWDEKIALVPVMINPETTREDLIDNMLPRVGIDEAVDFLYKDRHPHDKRKLHRLAMPMWRSRYSDEGLHSTIRTLAGSDSTYFSWFDLRTILGETHAGEGMILVGEPGMEDGESLSLVKLMDNGLIDEDLLLELVGMHRPCGEHIEILLLDFYDEFETESSRARWETVDSYDAATFDIDDVGKMRLANNARERAIIPIVPASEITSFVLAFRLEASADDVKTVVRFLQHADESYYYKLEINAQEYAPSVVLKDQDDNVLFSELLLTPLPFGVERFVRIEGFVGATVNGIALCIDGEPIFYVEDAASPRSAGGGFSLGVDAGAAPLEYIDVDEVEFTRVPARSARVSPRGVVTMTPNYPRRSA